MSPAKATVPQGLRELEQIVLARWTPEVFRRFQCVWLTHVLGLPASAIAKALALNVSTVRRIRTEFAREGIQAIEGKGNRGGRRNQCLSFEEEATFLQQHAELRNREGVGKVLALKAAFEVRVGRTIHKTTIYRLLERHGETSAEVGGEPAAVVARKKLGHRHKPNRSR